MTRSGGTERGRDGADRKHIDGDHLPRETIKRKPIVRAGEAQAEHVDEHAHPRVDGLVVVEFRCRVTSTGTSAPMPTKAGGIASEQELAHRVDGRLAEEGAGDRHCELSDVAGQARLHVGWRKWLSGGVGP